MWKCYKLHETSVLRFNTKESTIANHWQMKHWRWIECSLSRVAAGHLVYRQGTNMTPCVISSVLSQRNLEPGSWCFGSCLCSPYMPRMIIPHHTILCLVNRKPQPTPTRRNGYGVMEFSLAEVQCASTEQAQTHASIIVHSIWHCKDCHKIWKNLQISWCVGILKSFLALTRGVGYSSVKHSGEARHQQ